METFEPSEFDGLAMNGLDTEFLDTWINIECIRYSGDRMYTPLQHYAENGHLDVVKYLVNRGSDVTMNNNRAVCFAAAYGHTPVVKYLVESGADITAKRNFPIRWAARHEHVVTINYLLNTYIYTKEDLQNVYTIRSHIRDLILDYIQFAPNM